MAPCLSPVGVVGFLSRLSYGNMVYLFNNIAGFLSRLSHGNLVYLFNKLRRSIYGTALAVARSSILSLLSSIQVGSLLLVDEPFGQVHVFGQLLDRNVDVDLYDNAHVNNCGPSSLTNPIVTLTVTSTLFYSRLLLHADMGFAESYLLGEVTCDDLTAFFRLFILNRARLNNGSTWWSAVLSTVISPIARLTNRSATANTAETALRNAQAHYDLGNDLFTAFLSPDMTYSCPIWPTSSGPTSTPTPISTPTPTPTPTTSTSTTTSTPPTTPTLTSTATANPQTNPPITKDPPITTTEDPLSTAQHTKLTHILTHHLRLKPTDHLLELGTGWGSLAVAAAWRGAQADLAGGCRRVTSVTLSRAQVEWVGELVRRMGLGRRVRVGLVDYRDVRGGFEGGVGFGGWVGGEEGGEGDGKDDDGEEGRYDKIVSVEMIEAVGKDFLGTYFRNVDRLLKKDGGIAVFQCITMPEGRQAAYERREE